MSMHSRFSRSVNILPIRLILRNQIITGTFLKEWDIVLVFQQFPDFHRSAATHCSAIFIRMIGRQKKVFLIKF